MAQRPRQPPCLRTIMVGLAEWNGWERLHTEARQEIRDRAPSYCADSGARLNPKRLRYAPRPILFGIFGISQRREIFPVAKRAGLSQCIGLKLNLITVQPQTKAMTPRIYSQYLQFPPLGGGADLPTGCATREPKIPSHRWSFMCSGMTLVSNERSPSSIVAIVSTTTMCCTFMLARAD